MDLGSLDAAASCGTNSAGLQWLLGNAGKDRVHIVVLKEGGWMFVEIYETPLTLVFHFDAAVHRGLRGLL